MKRDCVLREKEEFSSLFRYGKRIETPLFRIFSRKNNLDYSRFGVIISKQVDKRAVKRNTFRRRVKEWIRKSGFSPQPNKDVIFFLKKEITIAPRKKVYEELEANKEKI